MQFFKLGLRNIVRNWRSSVVTILAVAFGFASINVFAGYIHNIYDGLEQQAVRGEMLAHITVMKRGAMAEGKLDPQKYMFSGAELKRVRAALASNTAVELTTEKLTVSGLVSNGTVATIFLGEGMVPADAAQLRGNFRRDRGGIPDPNRPGAGLLAIDLAQMLKIKVNDYATLLVSTVKGQTNAIDIEVSDTFNTGNAATNDKFMRLPLSLTQNLLGTDGADRVLVLLKHGDQLAVQVVQIKAALAAAGLDVELHTWRELSVFFNQVNRLFNMIFAFIFSIVLIVVLMSIINTMTMAVVERTREIGTLRAIGMNRRQVSLLFTVEGAQLVMLGAAAGVVLTLIVATLINVMGLSYVPPNSSDTVKLKVDFVPIEMMVSFVMLTVVASLAAFIPARRATRMKVVDALGHV